MNILLEGFAKTQPITPSFSSMTELDQSAGRKVFEVKLNQANAGAISLIVNIPKNTKPQASLPAVFLMSGFQTAGSLSELFGSEIGNNILVIMKYPLDDKKNILDGLDPQDAGQLTQFLKLPLGAAAALEWLKTSDFSDHMGVNVDTGKINTVAISLGMLFLPAAQRISDLYGTYPATTVFAFGGGNLDLVLAHQAKVSPHRELAQYLVPWFSFFLKPFEPTEHVSKLSGNFLILGATDDQVFPKDSLDALIESTPAPKEVIMVDGNHIGLSQPERVRESFKIIKKWMLKKYSVNR